MDIIIFPKVKVHFFNKYFYKCCKIIGFLSFHSTTESKFIHFKVGVLSKDPTSQKPPKHKPNYRFFLIKTFTTLKPSMFNRSISPLPCKGKFHYLSVCNFVFNSWNLLKVSNTEVLWSFIEYLD